MRAVPRKPPARTTDDSTPAQEVQTPNVPALKKADETRTINGTSDRDLSHAIDASRRYAANMSSPRKLPENRFHSIVKQLNGPKSVEGESTQDDSGFAASNGAKRSTIKKQPRKISSMLATNGANGAIGVG